MEGAGDGVTQALSIFQPLYLSHFLRQAPLHGRRHSHRQPQAQTLTHWMRDTKDFLPPSEVSKQPQESSGRGPMIATAAVTRPLPTGGQRCLHTRCLDRRWGWTEQTTPIATAPSQTPPSERCSALPPGAQDKGFVPSSRSNS